MNEIFNLKKSVLKLYDLLYKNKFKITRES